MKMVENRLTTVLSRSWWALLVRGLVTVVFGVLAWLQPGITLTTLMLLFGAYVLTDGLLGVWAAIAGRKENEFWLTLLLAGIVSMGIGVLVLLAPGVTAIVLVFYVAVWAIAKGVLEIVAAVRMRKEIDGEWFLAAGGLCSVALGLFLMVQPGAGAIALLWVIATYAIVFGTLIALLAFKVRRVATAQVS